MNCLIFRCDRKSIKKYEQHFNLCIRGELVKVKMVNEENKYLLFNERKLCHPIRAYCVIDFETTKMELSLTQKKDQNTTKTHLEVANSFGLYFKSWDDELLFLICHYLLFYLKK